MGGLRLRFLVLPIGFRTFYFEVCLGLGGGGLKEWEGEWCCVGKGGGSV